MSKPAALSHYTSQEVYDDVTLICESDEQGFFAGNEKQRHWLWYAFEFGCRKLLKLLAPFNIRFMTIDNWGILND
ncbi:hypothetical protein [Xenorhabdus cabanillasii]|uniref:Insertion element iso-IS1n protein insB n=1 Tax=Xenorhabdus cabanillasii JM26 TaxID=1427517 RepID=W1IN03_9GAMM